MDIEGNGKLIYVNGKIESLADFDFKSIDRPLIYEVIRVMSGKPVFLEDHVERLISSAALSKIDLPLDRSNIIAGVKTYIKEEDILDNNIKILLGQGEQKYFLIYGIDSFYPDPSYYQKGIKTILYKHERENPNIKFMAGDFRARLGQELKKKDAFEAILYDQENKLLEGSRSNMFFIREGKIYTAASTRVLEGVTRKYILKAIEEENLDLIYRSIKKDEISSLDGAFMSGTSVDLLPIESIDDFSLDSASNEIFNLLLNKYREYLGDYLKKS